MRTFTALTAVSAAALLAGAAFAQQPGVVPQQNSSSSAAAATTGSADDRDEAQSAGEKTSREIAEDAGSAPANVERNNPTGTETGGTMSGSAHAGHTMSSGAVNAESANLQGSNSGTTDLNTSAGTRGFASSTGGDAFAGVQVVTNGPVPDTAEMRRMYRPLSNAGRRTPTGEGPVR